MAKIALFANAQPGVLIAEYLQQQSDDTVQALYLCDHYPAINTEIKTASGLTSTQIFDGHAVDDPAHLKWFKAQHFDAIICVYWPYLLKLEVFAGVPVTVNFHPALLPINRGWFPHVHSILDGSPTGVTLHAIDANADTGPIWVQKEVPLKPTDTAKSIYDRLQQEIVALFKATWPGIKNGKLTPYPQDASKAVYHSKKEIAALDAIDLNKKYSGRELIALLKARSFGNKGFAYFEENGEKVYLNLRLSHSNHFEPES